jgi:hypothetical protein
LFALIQVWEWNVRSHKNETVSISMFMSEKKDTQTDKWKEGVGGEREKKSNISPQSEDNICKQDPPPLSICTHTLHT